MWALLPTKAAMAAPITRMSSSLSPSATAGRAGGEPGSFRLGLCLDHCGLGDRRCGSRFQRGHALAQTTQLPAQALEGVDHLGEIHCIRFHDRLPVTVGSGRASSAADDRACASAPPSASAMICSLGGFDGGCEQLYAKHLHRRHAGVRLGFSGLSSGKCKLISISQECPVRNNAILQERVRNSPSGRGPATGEPRETM